MLTDILLVAHIVVLGYWLGAEFVINSEYRYVSRSAGMPFAERARLMEHVMDVDQHVRYALVLQAGLGTTIAARLGYLPGGEVLAWFAAAVGILWLGFVEVTHRARHASVGNFLSRLDRAIRYLLLVGLTAIALLALTGGGLQNVPTWLAWKLLLFAGVILSGVGIRLALVRFFRLWKEIRDGGSSDEREAQIRFIYVYATSILGVLWLFIGGIVVLSVLKPW